METIYTFKKIGHFEKGRWFEEKTLRVFPDDDPMDPREYDNLGHMVCFHRRYSLGDKHDIDEDDFCSWEEIADYLESEYGAVIILPLYLMDHSGLSMSVGSYNDPWDSGQVGFIYATYHDLNREYGNTFQESIDTATRVLIGEVEAYDAYLSGRYVGFVLEDETGEEMDSCWGYSDVKLIIEEYGFSWRDEV